MIRDAKAKANTKANTKAKAGTLDGRFAATFHDIRQTIGLTEKSRMALALSGGGDSMALLRLLSLWAKNSHMTLPTALIVDHGLRKEAHAEAKTVHDRAKALGFEAHVLAWKGKKPQANIEDAARLARYRLLGEWCRSHKTQFLLVAHTEDDQAENFLLRLGRGSGVDGLAAMAAEGKFPLPGYADIKVVRPLLGFRRDELRTYLAGHKVAWIEDPMNDEARFARIRVRRLLPKLAAAGIPPSRIADAARHLARARLALEAMTGAFCDTFVVEKEGRMLVDRQALLKTPREISLRVLSRLLCQVSGQAYRPRFDSLERLLATIMADPKLPGSTLHGCKVATCPKRLQLFGAGTLAISPEPGRRGQPRTGKGFRAPHKGRILGHNSSP